MQTICDGLQTKRDVLNFTIEQYKEVYIKAKREIETVVNVSCETQLFLLDLADLFLVCTGVSPR